MTETERLMTMKLCLTPIYSLLVVFLFFTSCNGQVKTDLPITNINDPQVITNGHPKLVKTQGSNEYSNVHCGLQDKVGNLWFGTTGEGVYRYDGQLFTQFTVKNGLSSNTVWSIAEDKNGNIWFGTDSGVCRYDGKTITGIPITVSNGENIYPNNASNNNPSTKYAVWSIMQDKTGKIWFGTSDGMFCYDGTFFTRFLDNDNIINKDGLQLKMVDCILEDKNGIIWFASGMSPGQEGICRFDGKSITSFKPYGNGWIFMILEEENGDLLFDTRQSGVCRYDGKNITNISEKAGINNSSVWSILKDKTGNIWIGTELGSGELGEDGGLWRFDGRNFTKFTTKDGLCHNGVSCIIEDNAGNIWIGTRNNGLCRYDGKTFTNFTE